jgi:hypothetical protein
VYTMLKLFEWFPDLLLDCTTLSMPSMPSTQDHKPLPAVTNERKTIDKAVGKAIGKAIGKALRYEQWNEHATRSAVTYSSVAYWRGGC